MELSLVSPRSNQSPIPCNVVDIFLLLHSDNCMKNFAYKLREHIALKFENSAMKRHISLLIILCFFVCSEANADAGTRLIWTEILHLFIGNLIIGTLEGFLLAKVYNLNKYKCIFMLILANYFSAWIGACFIRITANILPITIQNMRLWLLILMAVTYVMTLFLEFPFVFFVFYKKSSRLKKAIYGSFLIQSISYSFLSIFYLFACNISLLTNTEIVKLSSISLPEKVFIYFISAADGDVYGRFLQEERSHKIYNLNSKNLADRLYMQLSDQDAITWNVIARLESDDTHDLRFVTIQSHTSPVIVPVWPDDEGIAPSQYGTWFSFGEVPKLGDAGASTWSFWAAFLPSLGLQGSEEKTGNQRVFFAFETPWVSWSVRNAFHLPTDKILLQLGNEQICLYDPHKRKIALFALGRGPVVIMKCKSNTEALMSVNSQ